MVASDEHNETGIPATCAITPRPDKLIVDATQIPDELKARPQWVLWTWTWKADKAKWDKPPFDAKTGCHASTTNPATWSTFEVAYSAYLDPRNDYSGIGYVFSGADDDVVGVDLDHCRDPQTGEIVPWTDSQIQKGSWKDPLQPGEIISRLASYAEVSPSSTGVKLLLRGSLLAGHKAGDFEAYRIGRYFTITGAKLPDAPTTINISEEALRDLESRFFAKFTKSTPVSATTATSPESFVPCPKCGSTAFWHTIYTEDVRCRTCMPVPSKFIVGKLLTLVDGRLVEEPKQPPQRNSSKPNKRQRPHPTNSSTLTATEVIRLASSAKNGEKFQSLFTGDPSGYPSHSEADSALCAQIAFFAGPQPDLIDEVFRQSRLYREKWDTPHAGDGRTYGQMTIANALNLVTEFYDPRRRAMCQLPSQTVGSLALVPIEVRRTKTKTIVDVQIKRDGELVDLRQVTSADSNRKAAVAAIAARLESPDAQREVEEAITKILLAASEDDDTSNPSSDAPMIYEVLAAMIPAQAKLLYRVDSRAFSDVYGNISRSAFLERFTNNDVLSACSGCSDVGRDEDGAVNRGMLITKVERELKLLWGDLLSGLPTPEDADVGADSKAAEEFRAALIYVWTKPTSMQMVRVPTKGSDREGTTLATRNSLVSRLPRALDEGKISARQWTRVQEGFDAWARLHPVPTERVLPDGEIVTEPVSTVFLAMRWQLAAQIGIPLPNVNNQCALRRLGEKFGCIDPSPPMSSKTSDGDERLAVLSLSVREELLYVPIPDELEATDR